WGTHAIDGSRFILGDPSARWVMGAVERISNKHERAVAIEDACMGLIHLEGDVQLFVQSDLYLEGADAGVFLVRGSKGLLDVTETSVRLLNTEHGDWQDIDLHLTEGSKAIGGETNAAQVRELLAWIEGGPVHRGNGRNAAVTVEIMMAMYESARQNRVINLPLEEPDYPLDLMIEEGKLPLDYPEAYDIRSFLGWEGIDREDYATLRAEGVSHAAALMKLHGLDGPPGRPDR
ncbi:MAG: hypothetical protein O7C67_15090, partial [Gammaproteobacteria bacterium]|nr:hypothetical protein [Gammaproteobacteria bacterium]